VIIIKFRPRITPADATGRYTAEKIANSD